MFDQRFPLDISSIVLYGIPRWQEDFFWPVQSPVFFNSILKSLDQGYRAIIAQQESSIIRENLLVRYKLLLECASLLTAIAVICALEKGGRVPFVTENENYFAAFFRDTFPAHGFQMKHHVLKRDFSLKERLMATAGSLRSSMKQYLTVFDVSGDTFSDKHNLVFQPSHFTSEYLRMVGPRQVRFLRDKDLISTRVIIPPLSAFLQERNRTAAYETTEMVAAVARAFQIPISSSISLYLSRLVGQVLRVSLEDLLLMQNVLSKFKRPVRLWTSTPSLHSRRVISAALNLREDGSEAVGFAHGEYTGHDMSSHYIALNMGTVNKFGVFQQNSIPLVTRAMSGYPEYARNGRMEAFALNTPFFLDFWETQRMKPKPDSIKRVMLLGVAYLPSATMSTKDLPSPLVTMDLELRILTALREAGFVGIYKAHPGSRGRLEFMRQYADEVLYDPFDQVIDRADAYVFYRPMTTTFFEAMCTKKPMIYFHFLERDWGDDFTLIQKRCRIVPTHLDDRNRFIFDGERFCSALRSIPEEPNMEFAERFLFPPA